MAQELDSNKSDITVIREAQSYIKANHHISGELVERAAKNAESRKGAVVDLSIVSPVIGVDKFEMGMATFSGFERSEGEFWQGVFVLVPGDVKCPVAVDQFIVAEHTESI